MFEMTLLKILFIMLKIVKLLRKTHSGCNLLLNDGQSAGQHVLHTHVHIIPRDKRDRIKIQTWKHKKMTKEEFEHIQNTLRKKSIMF